MKQPTCAEDLNYWQTSKSSPDTWIDRTKQQIETIGGKVLAEGYGSSDGRAAYMLAFQLAEEQFKIVWPVLPSRTGNQRAARVQAATMLYRDVKARCVSAQVLGTRNAFFAFLMLPDGQTISQVNTERLLNALPQLNRHQLTDGVQRETTIPTSP